MGSWLRHPPFLKTTMSHRLISPPPAMASPDRASGMGGSPEETELSITLTLRMLMHGKVMPGGSVPLRGH